MFYRMIFAAVPIAVIMHCLKVKIKSGVGQWMGGLNGKRWSPVSYKLLCLCRKDIFSRENVEIHYCRTTSVQRSNFPTSFFHCVHHYHRDIRVCPLGGIEILGQIPKSVNWRDFRTVIAAGENMVARKKGSSDWEGCGMFVIVFVAFNGFQPRRTMCGLSEHECFP